MAYQSDTHVTKDYSRTTIADVLGDSPLGLALRDKLRINFWDPWGLTAGGYKNLSLIHFLEGRIRPGTVCFFLHTSSLFTFLIRYLIIFLATKRNTMQFTC